jgi:NAD(P)-dependent dehydrogenase (short-subunit alcohol dehydrogenase family)
MIRVICVIRGCLGTPRYEIRLPSFTPAASVSTMASTPPPVALVTGASRGIGRCIAQQLAARGARIALHYRTNRPAAEETLRSLKGDGHAFFAADLGLADAPAQLFEAVQAAFGRIDVLVNNAGIFEMHPIGEVDYAQWQDAWQRTLALNLLAPAHLTFLTARQMAECRGGRIINISSRGAFGGQVTTPAYSASKAALNSMGHSFAAAYGRAQVLVFAIAPSWVDTDMAAPHIHGPNRDNILEKVLEKIPLGRVNTAEEVATTATWLALDAPATLTGCVIDMNGAVLMRP